MVEDGGMKIGAPQWTMALLREFSGKETMGNDMPNRSFFPQSTCLRLGQLVVEVVFVSTYLGVSTSIANLKTRPNTKWNHESWQPWRDPSYHWVGLSENLEDTPVFFLKLQNRGGSCRFAPKLHQNFPSKWGHGKPQIAAEAFFFSGRPPLFWWPMVPESCSARSGIPSLSRLRLCLVEKMRKDHLVYTWFFMFAIPFWDHPDKMLVLSSIASGNLT